MAEIDDGGPAFPSDAPWKGMSLRDWFAGMAMLGFIQHACNEGISPPPAIADWAYKQAEAMFAERKKGK